MAEINATIPDAEAVQTARQALRQQEGALFREAGAIGAASRGVREATARAQADAEHEGRRERKTAHVPVAG